MKFLIEHYHIADSVKMSFMISSLILIFIQLTKKQDNPVGLITETKEEYNKPLSTFGFWARQPRTK